MNHKVKAVLETILARFKSGDIPQAIAYATFPGFDIPSIKWSFMNKILMYASDTTDARGIRQWNRVGRRVKKGAKAIYILVPRLITTVDPEDEDTRKIRLRGFLAKPVFRMEDTEGGPLEYKELKLPDLPLIEKARQWGISVAAAPALTRAYGCYLPNAQAIRLATPDETVFFHELSHAAYDRAVKRLKNGQHWDQEIVAELSAQALCRIVGRQPHSTLGNSYRYIEGYAREVGLSPISACLQVLESVEKVLSLILGKDESNIDQAMIITNPTASESPSFPEAGQRY